MAWSSFVSVPSLSASSHQLVQPPLGGLGMASGVPQLERGLRSAQAEEKPLKPTRVW